MSARAEFERRVDSVVRAAERAAVRIGGEAAVLVPELPAVEPPAPGTPGELLARLLGLSIDEHDLVWTVAARAVEPRVGAHLRAVFGNRAETGVCLGHHVAIRELPADRSRELLRVLDPRHPLRTAGILLAVDGDAADVGARFTLAPRVWDFLRGGDDVDPAIAAIGGPVVVPLDAQVSPAQQQLVEMLRGWLTGEPATIVLEGALGSGRRVATALAGDRVVIAADFAQVAPRRAEAILLALRREALLADAVPVLANLDELFAKLAPGDDATLAITAALDAMDGAVVVTTSTAGIELRAQRRNVLRARWPVPEVDTRRALWVQLLGDVLTDEELDLCATRYELGAGGIVGAARSAEQRAARRGNPRATFADVVAGIQDNIAERLGELTRRVEVNQDWSELVLSPEAHDDLRALIGRIRHAHFVLDRWGFRRKLARGTGVAALFSGPPGTGKTMVAGLLARELQLELYQVDLSRIVSKWVGETEKQLARVFEAAEAGHALLLFDEADALFAKRSAEVKSAVDRYANLEVNYLLQRVESFNGVVVLTTNLDTSIDPALRRRLASHIRFAAPETEERARLWHEMLATGAPVDDDVDLRKLAEEFSAMTGANIRNAVLSAAFLAAEEGKTIGFQHLLRAARGEYRAMGHVLGKDFGQGSAGRL
jgi:hypothetical protein